MKIGKQEVKTRFIFLFLYCVFVIFFFQISGILPLSIWFIGYVLVCHLVAEAAERKNRNYPGIMSLSILLSPFIMGFFIAIMANPDKK